MVTLDFDVPKPMEYDSGTRTSPKGTVCKYEAKPRKPKAVGIRLSVVFIIHQKSKFVKSRLEIFPKKLNQITKSDEFLFRKAYLTNKTEFLIEINSTFLYQEEQHTTKQMSKHKNHITRFLNMLKTFSRLSPMS